MCACGTDLHERSRPVLLGAQGLSQLDALGLLSLHVLHDGLLDFPLVLQLNRSV